MALKPGTKEFEQFRKKNFNLGVKVPQSAIDKLMKGGTPSANIKKYAGTNNAVMREAMNRFYGKGWEKKAPGFNGKSGGTKSGPMSPRIAEATKPKYGTNTPSARAIEGRKGYTAPKGSKSNNRTISGNNRLPEGAMRLGLTYKGVRDLNTRINNSPSVRGANMASADKFWTGKGSKVILNKATVAQRATAMRTIQRQQNAIWKNPALTKAQARKASLEIYNRESGKLFEKVANKGLKTAKVVKTASTVVKAGRGANVIKGARVAGRAVAPVGKILGKFAGPIGLLATGAEAVRLGTTGAGQREYMDMRFAIDNLMAGKTADGKKIPQGTMYTIAYDEALKIAKKAKKNLNKKGKK